MTNKKTLKETSEKNTDKVTTFYGVCVIEKEHDVTVQETKQPLNLTWADGMVGVMPIFKSYSAAKKYAGKNLDIVEFQLKEEE